MEKQRLIITMSRVELVINSTTCYNVSARPVRPCHVNTLTIVY